MTPQTNARPATDPPTYLIELRPEPGIDGTRALRAALKPLLRAHGLRVVGVSAMRPPGGSPRPAETPRGQLIDEKSHT